MSKVYLLPIAALLVVSGCTRKSKDKNMIFEAIESGDAVLVRQYLASGADINIRKDYGKGTPLELKAATPLHLAATTGNKEIVEMLLASGANVNAKAEDDITPLHIAQLIDNKEIVNLLIANGADINARDKYGLTPMDIANIDESVDESLDEAREMLKKVGRDLK
jgi:cytohesin